MLKLEEWKHVFGRGGISLHLPLQFVMFSIIYIMLYLKTQKIPKLRQKFFFVSFKQIVSTLVNPFSTTLDLKSLSPVRLL